QVFQAGDPLNVRYEPAGVDMNQSQLTKLVKFVSEIKPPLEATGEKQTFEDVYQGEKIFNSIGCVDCHAADMPPAMNVFSDFLLHDMGERLQAPSPAAVGSSSVKTVRLSNYKQRGPVSGNQPAYYSGTSGGTGNIPVPSPLVRPKIPQFPRGELAVIDSAQSKKTSDAESEAAASSEQLTWDSMMREWRTPPLWGIADTGPYLHDGRARTLDQAILWHGGEGQMARDSYARLSKKERSLVLLFLKSLGPPSAPTPPPATKPAPAVVMLPKAQSSRPTLPDPY
ncbi:MAG: di-heme oxidoredictase family protein, partial [Planctomycetota bacterium]